MAKQTGVPQHKEGSRHKHPGKGRLLENGISYQNTSFPFLLRFHCQKVIRAEVRAVKKELDPRWVSNLQAITEPF